MNLAGEPQSHCFAVTVSRSATSIPERCRVPVIGAPIDVLPSPLFIRRVVSWAKSHQSRSVYFCNVHSAVLATQQRSHRLALETADLVAPDGAPIAWSLRRKGFAAQDRVDGPGTMWRICKAACEQGVKVGLFGSTAAVLEALCERLLAAFPGLQITYIHAPPFRESSAAEEAAVCSDVAAAGVGLLFVGLGCPKQERWIARHRGRIPAVMLGVGAAFDFHAGTVGRAPRWMRERGLEWLHRLASEPRRLGGRYLASNSIFIGLSAAEALCARLRWWARRIAAVAPATSPCSLLPEAPKPQGPRSERRRIGALSMRIDAALPPGHSHLVAFLDSRGGETAGALARAYALVNAKPGGPRVLLISASMALTEQPGLLETLSAGRPIGDALAQHGGGLVVASLGPIAEGDIAANPLVREYLLHKLRERFELIVIEMPAFDASGVGLALAPLCDGVVIVMPTEESRAPAVVRLIESLHAEHAQVLGTVVHERACSLPERLDRGR